MKGKEGIKQSRFLRFSDCIEGFDKIYTYISGH
jgi:hypothetical protein